MRSYECQGWLIDRFEGEGETALRDNFSSALFALASEAFPRDDLDARLRKWLTSPILYLVWADQERNNLAAAAARLILTVNVCGVNARVLYLRTAAVTERYRGRHLVELLWSCSVADLKQRPEVFATTTQHPAIYRAAQALAHELHFEFFPQLEPLAETAESVRTIGNQIISERGQAHGAVDRHLVRRGGFPIVPYDEPPYHGFAPFEPLKLGSADALLLLGIDLKLIRRILT